MNLYYINKNNNNLHEEMQNKLKILYYIQKRLPQLFKFSIIKICTTNNFSSEGPANYLQNLLRGNYLLSKYRT